MVGMGHDIWLAGLGAVATVEEEGATLFTTLVKRGEKLETQGRKRLTAVRADVTGRRKAVAQTVETSVYEPLLRAMSRFGVPTRGEIKDLTGKVEALTRQVDLLVNKMAQKSGDGVPQAIYYVISRDEGWVIGKEGMDQPIKVYPTKEDALEEARVLANKNTPSRLHVYKKDGTIQDTFSYGD
jgi:poly(hydroxyalkanoate) granule-associated protein